MPIPTVTFLGNFVRQFNGSDQDSPDQGSHAWFRQQPKEFYAAGFHGLVKQWEKCLNVQGDYVEEWKYLSSISIYNLLIDLPTYQPTRLLYAILRNIHI
jgi:hypothetical protein